MGEFRGCLICLEPCTVKKCDVEVIKDKEPEICTGHNEELNLMFILKKVLNVPSELIARNLIKHGSPSEWGISVCGSCKLTYLERYGWSDFIKIFNFVHFLVVDNGVFVNLKYLYYCFFYDS